MAELAELAEVAEVKKVTTRGAHRLAELSTRQAAGDVCADSPERKPKRQRASPFTADGSESSSSLAASASNHATPSEVSKPLDPAVAEDVGRVLNDLCERAHGKIVLLQELSANLEDGVIRKLGGDPDEARNPKSRSSNKRQFISTLKAYLESIFEVQVIQNTTGRAVADHSRFTGYYAENLRMRAVQM